ncbi:MAG: type II toxin-antitoxin system HicA family toxin [Burkholderiales bacterium]|nr:type II toxin-antitoxin system HicA family toxin [Anaerolineae bacterium]
MSKLPIISGRECVSALQRAGFTIRRQTGSHIVLQRDNPYAVASVPKHKSLKKATLKSNIRQAGMTTDEFLSYL